MDPGSRWSLAKPLRSFGDELSGDILVIVENPALPE